MNISQTNMVNCKSHTKESHGTCTCICIFKKKPFIKKNICLNMIMLNCKYYIIYTNGHWFVISSPQYLFVIDIGYNTEYL